jgi:hypothetical protein
LIKDKIKKEKVRNWKLKNRRKKMTSISVFNKLITSGIPIEVTHKAAMVNPNSTTPHSRLSLEPGDYLTIKIINPPEFQYGVSIDLHKDLLYEFTPQDPDGMTAPDPIGSDTRRIEIPGPHTPDWRIKIWNPVNSSGKAEVTGEENVTVGENQPG